MKFTRLIHLAFSNLWRRKLRTVLTVLGMAVGLGAMVLLISFASGLERTNRESLLSSIALTELTVTKQQHGGSFGGITAIPTDDEYMSKENVEKLQALPHVKYAYIPVFLPGTQFALGDQTVNAFLTPTPILLINDTKRTNIDQGAWWTKEDSASVVLSVQTVEALKLTPDSIVGTTVKIETVEYSQNGSATVSGSYDVTVTGVLKKDVQSFGPFGLDSVSQGLAEKISTEHPDGTSGNFSSVSATVLVDETENVASVREEVKKIGWYSTGADELLDQINQGFFIMKIVLGIIGGIGLVVALIGITNSMLMAVLERTREIGILSAIGASRRSISWLFILEAAWLGVFGAAVALGGAWLVGKGIVAGVAAYFSITGKNPGESTTFLTFYISFGLALWTFVGAVLATMFAGWLPARRAAKQDPVQSLRHE